MHASSVKALLTATEFCEIHYIAILEEIDQCLRDAYYPAIRVLYKTDPHDLVSPEAVFCDRNHAVGFVWQILITIHKGFKECS